MKPRNVAILLLVNERNEILLQHRSENAKRYPGHWGIFGGGIEEGESPEEAMRREMAEELEYMPSNPEHLLSLPFENKYGEGPALKYAFIERYDSSQQLKQHEGQGMGWFEPEEIRSLPIIDHDVPVYEAAAKFIRENYR